MRQLWQIFASFFKIGLFTIGGGMVMLPLIRRTAVEEKGWLTETEVVDCFAVCQALPGVIAINTATYIGKKQKGFPGALAASAGVILPSFLIIIGAAALLSAAPQNPRLTGFFTGVKAGAAGLILYAAAGLGRKVIKGKADGLLAGGSLLAIVAGGISAVWVILAGAAWGLLFRRDSQWK